MVVDAPSTGAAGMRRMTVVRLLATAACAALAATGCSDGGSAAGAGADGTTSGAGDGAFPVTIETAFGGVTVEAEPARVVALGWGDAETALALGVQPVGASDWLDFGGTGVGPWAEGGYDEPPKIIGTLEPSYEAVAALQPDLILDTKSSGDQRRYELLSAIAPTVGVPEGAGDYLTTTEQQTTMIAAALGRTAEGEELLADLDAAFAQVREQHPEWEGRTVTAATRTSETWGAYVARSERVDFLEQLGFVQNPRIDELEPDATGFSVAISPERLDLLDADLVVAFPIFLDTAEITDDPLWQQVPAVEDGRAVVIDGDLAAAYSLASPPAVEYAIDDVVPIIEEALR